MIITASLSIKMILIVISLSSRVILPASLSSQITSSPIPLVMPIIVRIISLVTPLLPRQCIPYVLLAALIPPLLHLLLKRLHVNRIRLLRLRRLQHKHQRVVLRRHHAEIILITHSVPVKVAISAHLALTNKELILFIGLSIRRREASEIV